MKSHYPSNVGKNNIDNRELEEGEEEAWNELLPIHQLTGAQLKIILKDKEGLAESEKLIPNVLVENLLEPRFNLDVEKSKVAKIKVDLLSDLDLVIRTGLFFNQKDEIVSGELLFDGSHRDKFRKKIIKQGGFLLNDNNYKKIGYELLTEMTKATMLSNQRVVLFWRGLILDDVRVKKILTAGLAFLIGSITDAELPILIRDIIPTGTFEISIKHKKDAYVIIGVEEEPFSY